MNTGECLGQRRFLGSHPTGNGAHRTERAPGAWGIDKGQRYAHNGCENDDGPKHASYIAPHSQSALAPSSLTQLYAEHGEDEEYHEQAETESAHKSGNLTMG